MPSYRIFFLTAEGRVDGGEAFEAANDDEAMTIYSALADACSDIPGGFMLWRGARRLSKTETPRSQPGFAVARLDTAARRRVLDLGETIRQGRWRVSRSARLQQATRSLRDQADPFDKWADFARAAANAEMATLQLLEGDELRLVGSCGFDWPFLDFFKVVRQDEACACGKVFEQGRQIVVPDIHESMIFAGQESLEVLESAGVRSVIATPLLAIDGRMVGVVSTHKSRAWSQVENESGELRQLADRIARLVTQGPAVEAIAPGPPA